MHLGKRVFFKLQNLPWSELHARKLLQVPGVTYLQKQDELGIHGNTASHPHQFIAT